VPYDAVQHRHLRIRHDSAGDAWVWETSPDGSVWTERRRIARPFPLDAVRGEMEAGTYRAESNPGDVLVDEFSFGR
jgi:hypothetical protein